MRRPRAAVAWLLGLVLVLVAGCSGGGDEVTPTTSAAATSQPSTSTTSTTLPPVFDDHTVGFIDSRSTFDLLAVEGLSFDSIAEAYEWGEAQDPDELPLDLRFTSDGRMYASQYYEAGLDDVRTRSYGMGSIVRVPARSEDPVRDEIWFLSLDFGDEAPPEQVERYFDLLIDAVDPGLADRLVWATRSPFQGRVGAELQAGGGPYADRVISFSDLAVPGESATYNAGIAVGRLRRIGPGADDLSEAGAGDVLLLESAPDHLPPAAALITATPQTPLAHVNLLARNRGIPNGYLAGASDDPDLAQLAAARAPVAIRADGDGIRIVALTDQQFEDLRSVDRPPTTAIPPVDLSTLADTYALADLLPGDGLSDSVLASLRPTIGGKAAGMLALLQADVVVPEHPMVISVAPYLRHLERVQPALDVILADPDFESSARIRYLVLEGGEDYDERYRSDADVRARSEFEATHVDDAVGEVLAAGGFKRYFRDVAVDTGTPAELLAALDANFADHSVDQGLRFRSSSSVEDVDGFNGAGLYDSNTGFLRPDPDAADERRTRSVEWALLKTWASYWSAEAYEERELERIDHLGGAMAVLVHARFDDELEVSNGVFTLTIDPSGRTVMDVNTQLGAVSVTNPADDPSVTPEVVRVTAEAGGGPEIERLVLSSLAGDSLLSDEALAAMFEDAVGVADAWLERVNADLEQGQQRSTLALDFEFRQVAEGWPALADGETHPARLVLKQVRSLDGGLRHLPPEALVLPIARDVLAVADLVQVVMCPDRTFARVRTRPLATPDFGFVDEPLIVELTAEAGVSQGDADGAAGDGDGDDAECEFDVLYGSQDAALTALFDSNS